MTSKAEGWPNGITGVSTFSVQDGMLGFNGVPSSEKAKRGDDGWYTLTRTETEPSSSSTWSACGVLDGSGWAEFAGSVVSDPAPAAPYVVGECSSCR